MIISHTTTTITSTIFTSTAIDYSRITNMKQAIVENIKNTILQMKKNDLIKYATQFFKENSFEKNF